MEGGAADGLEVLLASVAMDTRINLVLEDTVWSMSAEGPDFKYPTIIMTLSGAVACLPMESDSGNLAHIDTSKTSESPAEDSEPVPSVLTKWKWGGHPLIPLNVSDSSTQTLSSSSSQTETDVEALMENAREKQPHGKTTGLALPQRCSECSVGLASRKTLAFHLK